jgi:copper chaperone CopZ
MAAQTFHVPNVSCQHCVRRITQALTALPGVQTVRVDIPTKQVEVTYEGADTLDRVRATLEEIGYPPAA